MIWRLLAVVGFTVAAILSLVLALPIVFVAVLIVASHRAERRGKAARVVQSKPTVSDHQTPTESLLDEALAAGNAELLKRARSGSNAVH